MKQVFADSFYWIAISDPKDDWHVRVNEFNKQQKSFRIITSESVLLEFMNAFCEHGDHLRNLVVNGVRRILDNPNVEVVPQSRVLFKEGVELYGHRLDKGYSLTDCISMTIMAGRGVNEVLTHDHHFMQEGFQILFRDE